MRASAWRPVEPIARGRLGQAARVGPGTWFGLAVSLAGTMIRDAGAGMLIMQSLRGAR